MRESVKKYAEDYAKEYATDTNIETVKNLMNNMKWTLDQTLSNMGLIKNSQLLLSSFRSNSLYYIRI